MRKFDLFFATILVPVDYLALLLAGAMAYSLRFANFFAEIRPVVFALTFSDYMRIVSLTAIGWIIIFAFSGLYTIEKRKKKYDEFKKIILASTAAFGGVLAVMVFSRELFESRFILLAAWLLAIVFIWLARLILRAIRGLLVRAGVGLKRVAIIGTGSSTKAIAEFFRRTPKFGFKIIFQAENFNQNARQKLATIAEQKQIDQIFYISENGITEEIKELLDFADEYHIAFKYSAGMLTTYGAGLEFDTLAGVPIMEIKRTRLEGWGRIYKRILDLAGAIFLIILTSPIMFLTALAIKISSRGPLFFHHLRIGEYGKSFTYIKFRSMQPGTHEMRYKELAHLNIRSGPLVKFKDTEDPRITRVGRFLRKWSIDELPELFLVLAGKMSLVGPRPHHIEEVEMYKSRHKKVLTIKPGITGLAQISGRADLSFEEEVRLDTYYIEHWSLKLDLIILLKTPFAVAGQKGTY